MLPGSCSQHRSSEEPQNIARLSDAGMGQPQIAVRQGAILRCLGCQTPKLGIQAVKKGETERRAQKNVMYLRLFPQCCFDLRGCSPGGLLQGDTHHLTAALTIAQIIFD